MKLGPFEIKAKRWPWQVIAGVSVLGDQSRVGQKYGWSSKGSGMGRFGAGWKYSFGVEIGTSTVMLNLIWGTVTIRKMKPCPVCGKSVGEGEHARGIGDGTTVKPWLYHLECYNDGGLK